MRVHILATVRKEELLPAATMAFQTLRVGLPSAEIHVTYNNLSLQHEKSLNECVEKVGATRTVLESKLDHHDWIGSLIKNETEPFWICDTDMVFWDSVEGWQFGDTPLAGRYLPQYFCQFAGAITRPRLHTCLLWINPQKVKEGMAQYGEHFPDTYCTPRPTLADLINPRYVPLKKRETMFYDTCSQLYHALGGKAFTAEQNLAFDHLNFGTLSDLVAPYYPEYRWRETHFAIFENLELAKGSWRVQEAFYARHAC